MQALRYLIGQSRRAVVVAKQSFDDDGETEGQQQPVEVVELVQMFQQQPFDQNTGRAHQDRHDGEGDPIIKAEMLQQQIGSERAHHVLRAVREVDDVEHAENDGKPEAKQRVKRAVDQAEQQLPEQRLRRDAENFEHASVLYCSLVHKRAVAPRASRYRSSLPGLTRQSTRPHALRRPVTPPRRLPNGPPGQARW